MFRCAQWTFAASQAASHQILKEADGCLIASKQRSQLLIEGNV
jgi:hypothetical protein